jgi:DNA-binding transcriptional LysR family regulator
MQGGIWVKIEWLETVMAVVNLKSFSEAAALIPCSQSTVSRHVRSAEDELGVRLFKRSSSSNTVELTEEGDSLLPFIEKLLGDYEEVRGRIKTIKANQKTSLVLGINSLTFSSSSKGTLTSLLYLRNPEILLTIMEIPKTSRIEQLATGKVDAVLFLRAFRTGEEPEAIIDDPSIRCIPLGRQRLSIAFGESFAPENRDGISFKDLKEQSFVFHTDIRKSHDPYSSMDRHALFVRACLENGFEPDILLVERHLADIKQVMAVQGKGVYPSMIPSFLREYPGICYIPVIDAPYYAQYYLMSLEDNKNPGIRQLELFLKENFEKSERMGT